MIQRPGKATHQETRAHNSRLVLGTIYDRGPISRAAVARATGLTRTTVSDVVNELLRDGLAREIGRGPSSGGRAPVLLEVTGNARHLVGLDLGDKVFRGAIVDLRGRIASAVEIAVRDRDGDDALQRVFSLVDRLLAGTD
ncbi:MAG TPA: MarR family transcriptional regulator, partial [Candidatus Limnocylindrales bacterium]